MRMWGGAVCVKARKKDYREGGVGVGMVYQNVMELIQFNFSIQIRSLVRYLIIFGDLFLLTNFMVKSLNPSITCFLY